jgi:hypothetical protein
MAKGSVVEEGDHENLLERDGVYAALIRKQEEAQYLEEEKSDESESDEDHGGEVSPERPVLAKGLSHHSKSHQKSKIESELEEKTEIQNAIDEKEDLKMKENIEARIKAGFFKRLLVHNKPTIFIYIGIVCSVLAWSFFLTFGIYWAKMLFVM